ncbi:MAG: methyltransferase domain-containing protein [Deltaproteobacteria bacterium]|nr:methyltransferase domain-containing protein [Deltaproteobacteria bacterium]
MSRLLFERYKANGVPAFRLNRVHSEYRRLFVERIRSGRIRLDDSGPCLCGSNYFLKIAEKDRFGLPFTNFMCSVCGLMAVNPKISESSLPNYYAEIYHPLICGVRPGTVLENLVNEQQGAKIFGFLGKNITKSSIKVCDVGAASGSTLLQFRDRAASEGISTELYACEYEDNYIKSARKNGIGILKGGVESLKEFGVSFDLIILSHVFEHFYNPLKELKILKSLLAEKGLLYIEVPGVMELTAYGNDILQYLVHAHNYNFNLDSLSGVLAAEEFKLIRGDETIRAVFRIDNTTDAACCRMADNPLRIIEHIKESERKRAVPSGIRGLKRLAWESFYKAEALIKPCFAVQRNP